MNQQLLSRLTATLFAISVGQAPLAAASVTGDERQVGDALQESASLAGVSQADSPETGTEAVKVGEYQSQDQLPNSQDDTVATIYAHQVDGRQAATLYVKDIPILTTLGPTGVAQTSLQGNPSQGQPLKMGQASGEAEPTSAGTGAASYEQDPVWRATAIAALLNQAHRNQLAPETITAHWDSDRERYVLKLDGELFVTLDERLLPPDTTGDAAEDILQMANRLRRQFGGEPLTEVEGRPQPARQVAIGPVRARFSGMASWYGPGFHGRRSASGEIFNQHALTAAHPSLPFGTLLQVTNANTGRTVTVRVNDRGPFSGRRVIDLSAAAAQAIGMMRSGVAPVRVEVVSRAN